jgi:hypothetical protein
MRDRASVRDLLAALAPRLAQLCALAFIILAPWPAAAEPVQREILEQHILGREMLERHISEMVRLFHDDPRYSRGRTPEQIKESVEFVTGNVLFVLAHEASHAVISEFGIPVAGREEDAADTLASIAVIRMANNFADRVMVNAAKGWFLSDQRDRKYGVPDTYYDRHGMDLQRAYHIVCLLVGGQPGKFAPLANEVKLPAERQATCRDDFNNASWSWETLLKPYLRKADDPKGEIEVRYGPPGEYGALAEHGRRLMILEVVAGWLSQHFSWKRPISLEMQQCGEAGARWEFGSRKVVLCYELVREFIQLHREYGRRPLVGETMAASKIKHIIPAKRFRKQRQDRNSGGARSFPDNGAGAVPTPARAGGVG